MANVKGPWGQRIVLVAGEVRAIYPPMACRTVDVGNATPDILKVQRIPGDDANGFYVQPGYARPMTMDGTAYDPTAIAFYLNPIADGTVELIWR